MLLNDILKKPVRYGDQKLGHAIDCRFILDGKPSTLLAQARLVGIIVGPRTSEAFLGYERTSVRSPALLAHYFRWRQRGAFMVAWEDIECVTDTAIVVRASFTRWSPGLRTDDSATSERPGPA